MGRSVAGVHREVLQHLPSSYRVGMTPERGEELLEVFKQQL